jgi:valyl-tRNA synthetase
MYLSFEQVVADGTVKTVTALTVPAKATHAELQATTQDIRYTMDDATNPSASSGMVLATTHDPKQFLIEDVKRMRFTRGAGSDGELNVHYFAGRDV